MAKGSSASAASRPVKSWIPSRAFTALGYAVKGRRRNEQSRYKEHQGECHGAYVPACRRQGLKPFLKSALELESKQDLRAENQGSGFIQRCLNFANQSHRLSANRHL
jgi:hypothetical protein